MKYLKGSELLWVYVYKVENEVGLYSKQLYVRSDVMVSVNHDDTKVFRPQLGI